MSNKVMVVVGILENAVGEVLLSSRPEGKPYAGYWEFAGGKVEPHETDWDALKREFAEELGITLIRGQKWLTKVHQYEHALVCLKFFRVPYGGWQGQLQAKEGQKWQWQKIGDFSVAPMLPANEALLQALALPRHWSGCVATGLTAENGDRLVFDSQKGETDECVWYPHQVRGVLVRNIEQYQKVVANAFFVIWELATTQNALELLRLLQEEGASVPIVVCVRAGVDCPDLLAWGAHAVIV